MKQQVRLTQKNLVFGIYWGGKKSTNPGLNVWIGDRYVWPIRRKVAAVRTAKKDPQLQQLPFSDGVAASSIGQEP